MPFNNVLVALDGSEYSQTAADYAIWLASTLKAPLAGQHVVDPRMVDLFIAPEFAEELGFFQSVETSEKVFRALKKIGSEILELFSKRAFTRGLTPETYLDVGYVAEEIVKRAHKHELTVIGHRGLGRKMSPTDLAVGSVAERVARDSDRSVLIAIQPQSELEQIVVAYDGSEASRGALLAAERLAHATGKDLKVMTVTQSPEHLAEAELSIEQAQSFLTHFKNKDAFIIRQGHPARTLINYATETRSLVVMGAYGFKNPEDTVLGSTTTYLIQKTSTSLLVIR